MMTCDEPTAERLRIEEYAVRILESVLRGPGYAHWSMDGCIEQSIRAAKLLVKGCK